MEVNFIDSLPGLKKKWNNYKHLFREINVRRKVTLLKEGEIPRKIFIIKKGCLRAATTTSRGKEITFQFFFENEAIASIESFRAGQPSPISIKSVEPSTVLVLQKEGFETLMRDFPECKDLMFELMARRFSQYAKLFLTYLRTTPKERYIELLKSDPRILQRVPQHYIASFLGITPVSLSRIRKRI